MERFLSSLDFPRNQPEAGGASSPMRGENGPKVSAVLELALRPVGPGGPRVPGPTPNSTRLAPAGDQVEGFSRRWNGCTPEKLDHLSANPRWSRSGLAVSGLPMFGGFVFMGSPLSPTHPCRRFFSPAIRARTEMLSCFPGPRLAVGLGRRKMVGANDF
jgi:hypothetical protein